MSELRDLFENNRTWADERLAEDPQFFARLADSQEPRYLWIGCSDSRVPPNEIVGLSTGDLFVHRNVANVFEPSDINALAVLHYAVDVLRVGHVLVCGHYGCGGVQAALGSEPMGLIDAWLARIREVIRTHEKYLTGLASDEERWRRTAELNAVEQALSVCRSPAVQAAWRAGQELAVHAVMYDVSDGLLREIGFSVARPEDIEAVYEQAIAGVASS